MSPAESRGRRTLASSEASHLRQAALKHSPGCLGGQGCALLVLVPKNNNLGPPAVEEGLWGKPGPREAKC